MKFEYLEKKEQGAFITRYDLHYRTVDDKEKVYEIISRNPDLKGFDDIHNKKVDAVVLIMHDESGEKILINREFRMAPGAWVYNFPAGLIDEGETPDVAAARELWEETGLKLVSIDEVLPMSFSGVGITNEKSCCVIGKAEGDFAPSTSDEEEIEARWYTKDEVKELLKQTNLAARTQAYCYWWAKS